MNLKEDIIDNIIKFCSQKELLNNKGNENLINNIKINRDEDLYKIPLTINKFLEAQFFDIKCNGIHESLKYVKCRLGYELKDNPQSK